MRSSRASRGAGPGQRTAEVRHLTWRARGTRPPAWGQPGARSGGKQLRRSLLRRAASRYSSVLHGSAFPRTAPAEHPPGAAGLAGLRALRARSAALPASLDPRASRRDGADLGSQLEAADV